MLGSGFVANFYMEGLQNVPGQEVVLNTEEMSLKKAEEFAEKWGIPNTIDSVDKAIARDDVDLFIIALPNFRHAEVAKKLAKAGRAMVCTKPLARNAKEAESMLKAVEKAGVFNGYAETEVFAPAVVKVSDLINQDALGDIIWVRSREAHFGPHSDWFWNTELSGGGCLLDMGCHCVEVSRYFFGKDTKVKEVMAWGDTLVHKDKTRGEDNALLVLRFENGGIAHVEISWSSRGGLDVRNEVYGTEGVAFTNVTRSGAITAFVGKEVGYIVEKAELLKGWISPVPEEAFAYGYQAEMKHFVNCLRDGKKPRETFEDGYIVNRILDSAYESMKQRRWINVQW